MESKNQKRLAIYVNAHGRRRIKCSFFLHQVCCFDSRMNEPFWLRAEVSVEHGAATSASWVSQRMLHRAGHASVHRRHGYAAVGQQKVDMGCLG